jgi:hypothetical protein
LVKNAHQVPGKVFIPPSALKRRPARHKKRR